MVYGLRRRNSQGRFVAPSRGVSRANTPILNPRERRIRRDTERRGLTYKAPATKFYDIVPRNVRHWVEASHMPNVYQVGNYGTVIDLDLADYEQVYAERSSEESVVNSVRHLEVGYRTGVDIDGYPIGHLVYILKKHNINLSGLFLSGQCIEFASIVESYGEEE
jgi:hypothetical protein